MFSSLGFDSKTPSRGTRNNSKYVLEVPRGFSVHVFKSPSPPAYVQNGSAKGDYTQSRPQPNQTWKPSSNSYNSRPDTTRKPSFGWNQDVDYDRVLEPVERSKSHKPYGIIPGPVPDSYIYERSISSMSDLPGSPSSSSSSSSDTDSVDGASGFAVEVSSTRASSSTETLEATAYALTNRDANATGRSPYGQVPSNSSMRAPPVPPGVTLTTPGAAPTTRRGTVDVVDDDDDGTVIGEPDAAHPSSGPILQPSATVNGQTAPPAVPARRNSDERNYRGTQPSRVEPTLSRGSSQSRSRSTSPTDCRADSEANLRLPPGLQYVVPSHSSGSGSMHGHRATVSIPATQARPFQNVESTLSRVVSNPEGTVAANNKRCVRWTENLICPSPVPPEQRRKGWFNRRGDQLWTNDGRFKSPDPGHEYPADLAGYPEPNAGWMNEEGTRIDIQHRLIPKPPLRPALKRPKSSPAEQVRINVNVSSNTP